MEAQPAYPESPMSLALDELEELLRSQSIQPLHQLSEGAVLHWIRVVEGKDGVQLRYPMEDGGEGCFHGGMETDAELQLDPSDSPHETADAMPALEARLHSLRDELETYFGRKGYRASSERCDQMMVALARLSRYLSARCLRVRDERAADSAMGNDAGSVASRIIGEHPYWQHHFWEPYLNGGIVAWEQNSLAPFQLALQQLLVLLRLPPEERTEFFFGNGYPLRSRGRPRIKISVFSPKPRPLHGNSFFSLRLQQLRNRLGGMDGADNRMLDGLLADVRQFIVMIRENCYMLASEPGFLRMARPGLPVVRGSPTVHPFLLDSMDFFKKAILFHNGTYTREGGGLDTMFLQVRQLERFFRFHQGGIARRLRGLISECVIAWEENRLPAFTAGLVRIASQFRGQALAEP